MREKILGLIFFLFAICFVAIVVEECFLGGRQRRRRQREARKQAVADERTNGGR